MCSLKTPEKNESIRFIAVIILLDRLGIASEISSSWSQRKGISCSISCRSKSWERFFFSSFLPFSRFYRSYLDLFVLLFQSNLESYAEIVFHFKQNERKKAEREFFALQHQFNWCRGAKYGLEITLYIHVYIFQCMLFSFYAYAWSIADYMQQKKSIFFSFDWWVRRRDVPLYKFVKHKWVVPSFLM